MKYKRDPWYIAGLLITAISAVTIAVTMVFMYYGNNMAIIWCFIAMAVLAVGILLSQSVKRRYDEADARDGEPLPMFWRIRFGYHNLKVLVITKGFWRVLFAGLTALGLATTLVLGIICGINTFSKNSILKNPEYINCQQRINEYTELYTQARIDKDEQLAHEYFLKIEEYEKTNYNSEKYIKNCESAINSLIPWIIVSGSLTVFFAAILSAYVIHKRRVAKYKTQVTK